MEKVLIVTKLEHDLFKGSFTLICGGRIVRIYFKDIIRVEKCGSHTLIHTSDGQYQTQRCMQRLLRDLPESSFIRVSSAHIVSLRSVTRFTRQKVLVEGVNLTVTAYYRKQLLVKLRQILQGTYDQVHILEQSKNQP